MRSSPREVLDHGGLQLRGCHRRALRLLRLLRGLLRSHTRRPPGWLASPCTKGSDRVSPNLYVQSLPGEKRTAQSHSHERGMRGRAASCGTSAPLQGRLFADLIDKRLRAAYGTATAASWRRRSAADVGTPRLPGNRDGARAVGAELRRRRLRSRLGSAKRAPATTTGHVRAWHTIGLKTRGRSWTDLRLVTYLAPNTWRDLHPAGRPGPTQLCGGRSPAGRPQRAGVSPQCPAQLWPDQRPYAAEAVGLGKPAPRGAAENPCGFQGFPQAAP